jgi:hypothetical protein
MTKLFTTTLLLCLSILSIAQYTLTIDDVTFKNGVITGYLNETEKNIVIPDTFEGIPVIEIGPYAFYQKGIQSVDLPTTLRIIDRGGFYWNSITDIELPDLMTKIGGYAFSNNSLDELDLPDALEEIGEYAFSRNRISRSITIPPNIQVIPKKAFEQNDIRDITFPEGLKRIEIDAFYHNIIASVTLPSTLEYLSGFSDNQINKLNLPNSLIHIGERAFANNSHYNTLNIPNSVKYIDESAFQDCELRSVNLGSSLRWIGETAFEDNGISSISFPVGIVGIGKQAFETNKISSVSFPNSLVNIGSHAFRYNTASNFTVPSPTTSGEWNTYSSGETFTNTFPHLVYQEDNYTVQEKDIIIKDGIIIQYYGPGGNVTIPSTINDHIITEIGAYAFSNIEFIKITIEGGVKKVGDYAFNICHLDELVLEDGVEVIGENAFLTNGLFDVALPNSVIEIAAGGFDHTNIGYFYLPYPSIEGEWNRGASGKAIYAFKVEYIYLFDENGATENDFVVENGVIIYYTGPGGGLDIPSTIKNQTITAIGEGAFNEKSLSRVTIPSTVITIGDNAFRNNFLTSVTFNEGLLKIGKHAFKGNKIESINFPNTVNELGNQAFMDNELSEVNLPSALTALEASVFSTNNLQTIDIPDNVTSVGDSAFYMNSLTTIDFSSNITSIGQAAFMDNEITAATIPSGVKIIEDRVFYKNKISSLNLLGNISSIGISSFSGNDLIEIILPGSLITLDDYAFFGNDLTSIEIPSKVETIGFQAFYGNAITSLEIPNSVTQLGDGSFYSNELETVKLSNSLTTIGSKVFSFNNLSTIEIPEGVTEIGLEAFSSNSLISLNLPSTIFKIGSRAFNDNDLTEFNLPDSYLGNVHTWNQGDYISGEAVPVFRSYEIYSSDEDAKNITYYTNGAYTNNPTYYFSGEDQFTFQDAIKPPYEFEGWYTDPQFSTRIYKIELDFTENLEVYAKFNENGPYTLTINDVIFENGKIKDYLNTIETNIIIPNNFNGEAVTSIVFYAFHGNQLTSVILPNSVTTIGDWAFSSNKLTNIIIPNSVTTIGGNAFHGNPGDLFQLPSNYQGNIYYWNDTWGRVHESGDMVEGKGPAYTLAEQVPVAGILSTDKHIFSFYPNPSTDFIHSDLEVSTLTFSNSQGVVVKQFQSNATKYNVSNLDSGVYFIEATGLDGVIYTSKLIKH